MDSDNGMPDSTEEGTSNQRPIGSQRPLPRIPVRPSASVTALANYPSMGHSVVNRLYSPALEHNYESTTNLANYEFVKNTVFEPWLSTASYSDMLSRHILYKPTPTEWATVLPRRRYERFMPKRENNAITALAAFRDHLLIGFKKGQVILYDLKSMCAVRSFNLKGRYSVTQIIVGKKRDRFFITAANEFIEYGYDDEVAKYKFQCPYVIKKVLTYSVPMLIVDGRGGVYEYTVGDELSDALVLKVEGLDLEEISYIQELKSFDFHIHERTRPCFIRRSTCIAIVDLTLNSNNKLILWRKEMLSSGFDDNITICCAEEKFFYAYIPSSLFPSTNCIYVSKFNDIRSSTRVELIKTTSGLLLNMKCSGDYLIAQTQKFQLEFFEIESHNKVFQLSFEYQLNHVYVLRNTVLIGTCDGAMLSETLKMDKDMVCYECKNQYYFESIFVFKRCSHNLPQETIRAPLHC